MKASPKSFFCSSGRPESTFWDCFTWMIDHVSRLLSISKVIVSVGAGVLVVAEVGSWLGGWPDLGGAR